MFVQIKGQVLLKWEIITKNGVGSFKNLIFKNYGTRKKLILHESFLTKNKGTICPRGSNGANGNEMHIIFVYGPRLLRLAMWPMGLLFGVFR
jgi:hypothetical protein